MSESPTEVWNRGHADGLAGSRDEALYAQDSQSARMYRDGHRMARRTLEAPIAVVDGARAEDPATAARLDKHIGTWVKVPIDADPAPSQIPESVKFESPDHASAFSDPIPGKKRPRAKPVDPDQASLF